MSLLISLSFSIEAPLEHSQSAVDFKSELKAHTPQDDNSQSFFSFLFHIFQRPNFLIFNLMQACQVRNSVVPPMYGRTPPPPACLC